jgi:Spy/CpxP family protein refolding chaperone
MQRNKLFWVIIAALVFVASSVSAEQGQAVDKDKGLSELQKQKIADLKLEIDQLNKELNFTPKQKAKIDEIKSKAKDKIQRISDDARLKINDIRVKLNKEIDALLTPEQKEKIKQFNQKHQASNVPVTNPAR